MMTIQDKVKLILLSRYKHDKTALSLSYTALKIAFSQYAPTSLRSALSRLIQQGDIEKIETLEAIYFRLTRHGYESIVENYGLFKLLAGNDESNRKQVWLLIFSFPETQRPKRDFLRRVLVQEGWLRISTSVYAYFYTPSRFITQMIKEMKWRSNVFLVKVEPDSLDKLVGFVKNQVDLDSIYAKYLAFISHADGVLGVINMKNRLIGSSNLIYETIHNFFVAIDNDVGFSLIVFDKTAVVAKSWERFSRVVDWLEKNHQQI